MRSYRPSSRPVSEMDQLASLSRSGGHAQNEDALLDFKTQQRYRAHLEDKVSASFSSPEASSLCCSDQVEEGASELSILPSFFEADPRLSPPL